MRHSDTFSAALFNVALHGEVQDIQIQGAVGNGLTQLFSCADDIALMSYGAGSTEGTIIGIGEERDDTWFINR
jgi:hypothetical protein